MPSEVPSTSNDSVKLGWIGSSFQFSLLNAFVAMSCLLTTLTALHLFPQSSCISFTYWKETVSILLSPDRTSPCAIVSYIDEAYMDIDRDFSEE